MTYVDALVGKVQIVAYVIIGIFLIVSIASYLNENQAQLSKTIDNNVETITKVSPNVLESAQTICNLDEIVISVIDTGVIDEAMLGWSTGQANKILAKWAITERVETCEIVMLDELLSHEGIENDWRSKLGIKNSLKNQVCNVLQCFEEKGGPNYLIKDRSDSIQQKISNDNDN